MANEVAGIDVVARLDAFRSELAKIPDIGSKEAKALVGQLEREIKKAEKASKAAADAAKRAKKETDGFADSAGRAGSMAGKFAQGLGVLSPELQGLFTGLADAADGLEGVGDLSESTGLSIGTLGAGVGVATAAILASVAAYQVATQEVERINAAREVEHSIAQSLVAAERALEDARLDEAVATGALSEQAADEVRVREAARRAVIDYGEALRAQRKEQYETIAANEAWADAQRNLARGLAVVEGVLRGAGWDEIRSDAKAIEDTFDALTGWNASIEQAKANLEKMADAEQKHADKQGEIVKSTLAADRATAGLDARTRELAEAQREEQARLEGIASAVVSLEQAADVSSLARLTGEERVNEELERTLDQYADIAKKAGDAAETEEERATVLAAYERARVEAVATAEAEISDIRAKAAEEESQRRTRAAEEAAREVERQQRAVQDAIDASRAYAASAATDIANVAGATADLIGSVYDQRASIVEELQARLEDSEANLSDAQRRELEAQLQAQKDAALKAWEAQQAAKLAEAALLLIVAEMQAAASAPWPYNLPAVAAATAMGVASITAIGSAEPPTFHTGTLGDMAPDEYPAVLQRGEPVLSRQARAVLGDETIRAAQRGQAPSPAPAPAYLVYRHQGWSRIWRDATRLPGPLRDAVSSGERVGLRGRGRR